MIGVTAAGSARRLPESRLYQLSLGHAVMLGVLFGSLLGARTPAGAKTRVLRIVFGLVVAAMAVEMIGQRLARKARTCHGSGQTTRWTASSGPCCAPE